MCPCAIRQKVAVRFMSHNIAVTSNALQCLTRFASTSACPVLIVKKLWHHSSVKCARGCKGFRSHWLSGKVLGPIALREAVVAESYAKTLLAGPPGLLQRTSGQLPRKDTALI